MAQDESARTRKQVLLGLAQIEQGQCIEIRSDEEMRQFLEDVITRGRRRLAAMQNMKKSA